MSIQVFMDRPSDGGRALQNILHDFPGDGLVNWTGRRYVESDLPVLNRESRTDKLAQLIQLSLRRVPTVEWRHTAWMPLEPGQWLPRRADHQQGFDFTKKRSFTPDFWTKFTPFTEEWRVHVFKQPCGKMQVLRSGLKMPKEGVGHHPWVRSNRLGWKISYIGGASDATKQLARDAVSALQLDFGAVDIGMLNGTPQVLEVNTCPGLEGKTLLVYAEHISKRLR